MNPYRYVQKFPNEYNYVKHPEIETHSEPRITQTLEDDNTHSLENERPEQFEKQNDSRLSRRSANRNTNSYSEIYNKKKENQPVPYPINDYNIKKDFNYNANKNTISNNNLSSLINETSRKNCEEIKSNPNLNSIDPSVCNYNLYSIPSNFYDHVNIQKDPAVNNTNFQKNKPNIPLSHPLTRQSPIKSNPIKANSNIMQRLANKSQNNSIELSQLSAGDKAGKNININSQQNLNYSNNRNSLTRSKSVEKLRSMARERQSNSKNSKHSKNKSISSIHSNDSQGMYKSVDMYLHRRHWETQEKIEQLKNEKLRRETEELRDRPHISKNSQIIVDRLVSNKQNVFDRLTSNSDKRKKIEKLNKIEEINNKNTNRPLINETSEKLQRTIDDLYLWHKNLNEKKEVTSQRINKPASSVPKILKESEEILKEKYPDYLKNRVEDRLIERGLLTKYKLEEAKENFIYNICGGNLTTKNKSLNAEKFEFNNKNSNDSYADYLNIDNIQSKDVVRTKQGKISEENKNKIENENSKKLTSSRSNSRIIPKSQIKSTASTRPESKKPEKRKDSKKQTKEIESGKNLSRHQSPLKTENSFEKKNKNIYTEAKADLKNESTPKDKILDIRSHLNKFYEAKTQSQKDNVLKEYMTKPLKSNSVNKIKSNEAMSVDSSEKNKILNSIINTSGNYFINNNEYNNHKDQTNQIERNYNSNTNSSIKINRTSNKQTSEISDNKSKISIESPKKYREDICLYNSRESTVQDEIYDDKGIFTFDRNRNRDRDDSIENFELTKESSLNRYNFKTDFVVPRTNKNSESNIRKLNKAPHRDTDNSINYINTNQSNPRISFENPIILTTNSVNYSKIKTDLIPHETQDQKAINKSFNYKQGKDKRLQELSLMNSYIDSLSQGNPTTGPITHVENNSNQNNKKTNIMYIPSKVAYNTEANNEEDSRLINKSSFLFNSNSILNEKINKNQNDHCLDSQIEQESIRHEITKKLKNQVYEKEYARVNNQIDYVNERLKLNELSKSYLMTKINEYSVKANVEDSIGEYDNQIGNRLETYKRKKIN